jgi:hypothetical protein
LFRGAVEPNNKMLTSIHTLNTFAAKGPGGGGVTAKGGIDFRDRRFSNKAC